MTARILSALSLGSLVGLFAYAATDLYLQHPWWLQ